MLRRSSGFTLVEVLVALMVAAIALGAVLATVSSVARNGVTLRDKTFAQWVAMNRLAELRAVNAWPKVGQSSGRDEMGGQEWAWVTNVSETEVAAVRRLEVMVRFPEQPENRNVATLIGFLPRPGN